MSSITGVNWPEIAEALLRSAKTTSSIDQVVEPPPPNFEQPSLSQLHSASTFPCPPIDSHFFGLLHGDALIGKSPLEGGNALENMRFLHSFLQTYRGLPSRILDPILKKLQTALDVPTENEWELMREVEKLNALEEFVYPFGWTDHGGGHAILVSFTRQRNGNYTIRLFNSGSGLEYHDSLLKDRKKKTGSSLEIRDIEPAWIGIQSNPSASQPLFFKRLLQFQQDSSNRYSSITAEDFYQKGFGHLFANKAHQTLFDKGSKGIQFSGTCSLKSVLAWMHAQLGTSDYKQFLLDLKYSSSLRFYADHAAKLNQDSSSGDEIRRLLSHAVRMQSRRLAETQGHWLSLQEQTERTATLKEISDRLTQCEMQICTSRQTSTPNPFPPPSPLVDSYSLDFLKELFEPPAVPPKVPTSFDLPVDVTFSATQFANQLDMHLSDWNAVHGEHDCITKQVFIARLIRSLPSPDSSFWKEIPLRALEPSLDALDRLFQSYASQILAPHSTLPQEHAFALKLTGIIWQVTHRYDQEGRRGQPLLGSYSAFLDSSKRLLHNPGCLFDKPGALEETLGWLGFLQNQGSSSSLLCNTEDFATLSRGNADSIPTVCLLREALKQCNNPALEKEIVQQIDQLKSTYPHASLSVIGAAALLTSLDVFKKYESTRYVAILCETLLRLQLFTGELTHEKLSIESDRNLTLHHAPHVTEQDQIRILPKRGYRDLQSPMNFSGHPYRQAQRNVNMPSIFSKLPLGQHAHAIDKLLSENQTLTGFKESTDMPFWNSSTALLSPAIQLRPFEILAEVENNLSSLSHSDAQTLLEGLLYAPLETKSGWRLPFWEEMKKHSPLEKELNRVVGMGLTTAYERRAGQRPELPICLFLIRLAIRAQLAGAELEICPTSLLKKWISLGGWSHSEYHLLHLHHLAAHAAEQKEQKEELSDTDAESILTSWIGFTLHNKDPIWQEHALEVEISDFIYGLKPVFKKILSDPAKRNSILNSILKQAGVDDLSSLAKQDWRGSGFPVFRLEEGSRFWEVNLLTGKIRNESGTVQLGTTTDFSSYSVYKWVFGSEKKFAFRKAGEWTHFISDFGPIRLKKNSSRSWWKPTILVIERRLPSGQWARLIDPSQLKHLIGQVPLGALSDQTHWVLEEDPKTILCFDRKSLSDSPAVTVSEAEIVFQSEGGAKKILSCASSPFTLIEKEPHAVHFEEDDTGSLTAVLLRYTHSGTSPLRFRFNPVNKRWIWEDNQNCWIADQPVGLLGPIPNYLLLNEEGEEGTYSQLLLVPCKPVLPNTNHITGYHSLDVEEKERERALQNVKNNPLELPQRSIYSVALYRVKTDKIGPHLLPLTHNDALFKVYLFLIQRDYPAALVALKALPSTFMPNTQTREILKWIFEAGTTTSDATPENISVKLRVFIWLSDLTNRPEIPRDLVSDDLKQSLKNAYELYLRKRYAVPKPSRLTLEEEEHLSIDLGVPKTVNDAIGKAASAVRELPLSLWKPVESIDHFYGMHATPPTPSSYKWEKEDYGFILNSYARIEFANDSAPTRQGLVIENFAYWYNKARSCKTEEEAILFCVEFDYNTEIEGYSSLTKALVKIIHFALLFPRQSPRISGFTPEDKLRWVQNTYALLLKHNGSHSPLYPPRIQKSPTATPAIPPSPFPSSDQIAKTLLPLPTSPTRVKLVQAEGSLPSPFENWTARYFAADAPIAIPPAPTLSVSTQELTDAERPFENALQTRKKQFETECAVGAQQLSETQTFRLRSASERLNLQNHLLKGEGNWPGSEKLAEEIETLKNVILGLADKRPSDPEKALQHAALLRSGSLLKPSFEQLILCWGQGTTTAYQKCNPLLDEKEISSLDQLISLFLERSILLKQAQQILEVLQKIEEKGSSATLENRCATLLQEKSCFSSQLPRPGVLTEYLAEIRLRPAQTELIRKLGSLDPKTKTFPSAIIKLLMGEGKSHVIGPILLAIAALENQLATTGQEEKIPIFIPPMSLFQTLSEALSTASKELFSIESVPISLERKQLSSVNLLWVHNQLLDAKKGQKILLISPSTVPTLLLELFQLLRSQSSLKNPDPELNLKIGTLHSILKLLKTHSVPLIDEMHDVLRLNRELNFPSSSPKHLEPQFIDWMRMFIEKMLDPSLKTTEGASVASILDLRNEQRTFDQGQFQTAIAPILAATVFEKTGLPKVFHDEFLRYTTGVMDPSQLSAEDSTFLSELQRLTSSPLEEEMQRADLLALTKYLLTVVFPWTLNLKIGEQFGRKGESIVPFDGPDTPTSNHFGNPYVTAVLHFLCAICKGTKEDRGISLIQVRKWMESLQKASAYFSVKNGERYDETQEARQCLQLTGIPLTDVLEKLPQALQFLQGDLQRVLTLETDTIFKTVEYFPSHDSANALTFISLFPSARGMSGTPNSPFAYHKGIREQVIQDEGVNGKVSLTLLRKWEKDPAWKTIVANSSVEQFITPALITPDTTCFIDAASVFRYASNEEIANKLFDFLQAERPGIQGVIYFGREKTEDPGSEEALETRPDTLMAIVKGKSDPIVIGSSDNLKQHGLDPSNSFTFLDGSHCQGVNIAQAERAQAIITVGSEVDLTHLLQSAMRMRKLISGEQTVRIVIPEPESKLMLRNAATPDDLMAQLLKNETLRSGKEIYDAAYKSLIESVRSFVIEKLRSTQLGELATTLSHFDTLLTTKVDFQPSKAFAALDFEQNPLVPLNQLRQNLLERCHELPFTDAEIRAIEQETSLSIQEALASGLLPSTIRVQASSAGLDEQVHIMREVQVEVEVEQKRVELRTDLQRELERYLSLRTGRPGLEIPWQEGWIERPDFPFSIPEIGMDSLLNQMGKCPYYYQPYGEIFSEELLFASNNWSYTCQMQLPVFHPTQKPAQQLLATVTDRGVRLVLLSIQEAEFFKNYLKNHPNPNYWILLSTGDEVSSHTHLTLDELQQQQLDRGLLQVHLFNGDIRALDRNEEQALQFIQQSEVPELIRDFLSLRVEKKEDQRAIYYQSAISGALNGSSSGVFNCTYRREYENTIRNRLSRLTEEEIAHIEPRFVSLIPVEKVCFLQTKEQLLLLKPKQVKGVPPEKVKLLPATLVGFLETKEQLNSLDPVHFGRLSMAKLHLLGENAISQIAEGLIPKLSIHQVPWVPLQHIHKLSDLQIPHVSAQQVPHLAKDKLRLLSKREQIAVLDQLDFTQLTQEQLPLVAPHQVHWLAPAQFKLLRFSDQVATLSQNEITHLTDAQLGLLSPQQVAHLEPARVLALPNEQICHLAQPAQVRRLPIGKVQHVGIQALPLLLHSQVVGVGEALLSHLPETELPYLSTSQIGLLPPEKVNHLTDAQLPYLRKPEQVAVLSPERLTLLPVSLTPLLSADQVPHCPKSKVPFLTKPQLASIQPAQLPHVKKEQVPGVPDALVPHLNFSQVPGASATQIPLLPSHRVPYLVKEQLPHLTSSQVESLTDEQLKQLSKPELIPFVPSHKVALLPPEAVPHLEEPQLTALAPAQLAYLTPQQASLLNKPEQIRQLTEDQLKAIAPNQVPLLDPSQVKWIPAGLEEHVVEAQVHALTTGQLQKLSRKELLQHVPLTRLQELSPKQVVHLTDKQIAALPPPLVPHLLNSQLSKLCTRPQMRALTKQRWSLLTRSQLKTLLPTLYEKIALIVRGAFHTAILTTTYLTGIALTARCWPQLKKSIEDRRTRSRDLILGLRAIC